MRSARRSGGAASAVAAAGRVSGCGGRYPSLVPAAGSSSASYVFEACNICRIGAFKLKEVVTIAAGDVILVMCSRPELAVGPPLIGQALSGRCLLVLNYVRLCLYS